MRLLTLTTVFLALAGCMSDQQRADVQTSAQVSYNAAESLPPSPQTVAIEANQVAIGNAVGLPITQASPAPSTTAAAVAGAKP